MFLKLLRERQFVRFKLLLMQFEMFFLFRFRLFDDLLKSYLYYFLRFRN